MDIERVGSRVVIRARLLPRVLIALVALAMASVVWLLAVAPVPDAPFPPRVIAWVLIVFGVLALSIRSELEFDPDGRAIRHAWGFLVLLSRREWPIQGGETIQVERKVVSTSKSRKVVYPVSLVTEKKTHALRRESNAEGGRRFGELVAKTMRLPLVDTTAGVASRREPEHLDAPLAARIERVDPPSGPAPAGLRVEDRGSVFVRVAMPAPPYAALVRAVIAVAALLPLVFVAFMTWRLAEMPGIVLGVVALFSIVLLFVSRRGLRDALSASIATADDAGDLIVEIGGRTKHLRARELEEFLLVTRADQPRSFGPRLVARSDAAEIGFGHGLDDAQAAWVHRALLARLTRVRI